MNILEDLKLRGIVHDVVFEEDLIKLLEKPTTFYFGVDPTGRSLHLGHFAGLMLVRRMQDAGHKPILLMGGGTAIIGDPSFRSDMRPILTDAEIVANIKAIKGQCEAFIDFKGENKAIVVNNADWLLKLNYVEFLREVGDVLSVNKMLSHDCFKTRMESGLSFLELNYMPMQAYDFYYLFNKYGCALQIGGSDQWANILAGADLIRRKKQKDAFAFTMKLLLTSEGKKMGKTAKGAIFLDPNLTSPFEMFQYLRNVDDADVETCLKLLTLVSIDEIKELTKHKDERMNKTKERLAFEVLKLIHGENVAKETLEKAKNVFSGDGSEVESIEVEYAENLLVSDLLVLAKFALSKGEAKRLITGGGVKVDGENVADITTLITKEQLKKGVVLQKGKKNYLKITFKGGR